MQKCYFKSSHFSDDMGIQNTSFTLKSEEKYFKCHRDLGDLERKLVSPSLCSMTGSLRLKYNQLYRLPKAVYMSTYI